jgi:hypothetical protein
MVLSWKAVMSRKRRDKKPKNTEGYRDPLNYTHMSSSAQHELLYTKRTVRNKKEEKILKIAHWISSYKLYYMCYIGGTGAFMVWTAFGRYGLFFGIIGMSYIFYRFVRMNWSFEARVTYEREYPVKTITEVHKEHVNDGLRLSAYSIALTLALLIAKNIFGI